jgi:D-inositol-3-phosphate glycosyltransferase
VSCSSRSSAEVVAAGAMKVALLTGGKDPHYARGLARELAAKGVQIALVGGPDEMLAIESGPGLVVRHDLVGDQDPEAGWLAKATRVMTYYVRLMIFAAHTDARVFHILWFRKFPQVERILLTLYLKVLGKKLVFTAHNVDDYARDGRAGGLVHKVSLRLLYKVADHLFVHTESMRGELSKAFRVPVNRVTVVPLGLNDVIPAPSAMPATAREKLELDPEARALLFFGNIAPYKGLEDLVRALSELVREDDRFILVIVGRVKDRSCKAYWQEIEQLIAELKLTDHVRKELRYVPDGDVGLFFRAADVSVLPYRRVYQSGVLGLSYAQGLPVIAADVGSMKEDIVEGETGLLFRAGDAADLAARIRAYFASDLFKDLEARAPTLRDYGEERFSWKTNADRTYAVYERLLR